MAVMLDDRAAGNEPLRIVGHPTQPAVAVIPTPDVEPPPAVAVKTAAIALKPPAVAEKPPAALLPEFWAGLLNSQRLKLRTMANWWDGSLFTRTMSGFRRQAGSVADSVNGLLQRAAQGIQLHWSTRLSTDPQGKTRLR